MKPLRIIRNSAPIVTLAALLGSPIVSMADVFPLPAPGEDMIGAITTTVAGPEDTLIDVARMNGLGYDEIRAANPAVDAWMPRANSTIVLPKLYLLPAAPREGIVINVAEMRLYYFPKPKAGQPATVETYPVSVGRGDWNTPLVTTRITSKIVDPSWTPPKSIRAEHAENGDPLPSVVKPGPDNPLGKYALRLSLPSYLLHGTNNQYGIGMQVTHGCMRLYDTDIERLYKTVPVGTTVRIVNQRYKAGWHQGVLYFEAHPPLEGPQGAAISKTDMVAALTAATKAAPNYTVDWHQVDLADLEANGVPIAVGPQHSVAIAQ